jgi:hypothetical protein
LNRNGEKHVPVECQWIHSVPCLPNEDELFLLLKKTDLGCFETLLEHSHGEAPKQCNCSLEVCIMRWFLAFLPRSCLSFLLDILRINGRVGRPYRLVEGQCQHRAGQCRPIWDCYVQLHERCVHSKHWCESMGLFGHWWC